LQHHTKQYGTSNDPPLPQKRLICESPGSNPGNEYIGLGSRPCVWNPMPTKCPLVRLS
jgi:hypothetical protein